VCDIFTLLVLTKDLSAVVQRAMEALEERTNTLILGVLAVAVAVIGIVVALVQLRVLSQKTRRLDVYELP
jgi:hypothetical protein